MSNAFSKPTYVYKRFRVKRPDGGSTTVSVDPALVVQACQVLGSLSTVSRIVREAAVKFDPEAPNAARNRSAHVSRTLKAIVAGKGEATAEKVTEQEDGAEAANRPAATSEVASAESGDSGDDSAAEVSSTAEAVVAETPLQAVNYA